jgi:mRNA-degrading endonuclease RelE of RelBE toxin-antitoxin system
MKVSKHFKRELKELNQQYERLVKKEVKQLKAKNN